MNLWLDPIPHGLRNRALEALAVRDVCAFLGYASNENSVRLVYHNRLPFQMLGILESGIADAMTATRTNYHGEHTRIRRLLAIADRKRLRDAGEPIPGTGPYELFRGVAGIGGARKPRGWSWTADPEVARWFARRLPLPNPAVVRAIVPKRHVLFYSNERKEQEFVVSLPRSVRVETWERCVPQFD
jgi:hypothetical protein